MIYTIYYILVFAFIVLAGGLILFTDIGNHLNFGLFSGIILFILFMVSVHYIDDWIIKLSEKRGQKKLRENILIIISLSVLLILLAIAFFNK